MVIQKDFADLTLMVSLKPRINVIQAEPGDVVISSGSGRVLLNIKGKLYVLADLSKVINE